MSSVLNWSLIALLALFSVQGFAASSCPAIFDVDPFKQLTTEFRELKKSPRRMSIRSAEEFSAKVRRQAEDLQKQKADLEALLASRLAAYKSNNSGWGRLYGAIVKSSKAAQDYQFQVAPIEADLESIERQIEELSGLSHQVEVFVHLSKTDPLKRDLSALYYELSDRVKERGVLLNYGSRGALVKAVFAKPDAFNEIDKILDIIQALNFSKVPKDQVKTLAVTMFNKGLSSSDVQWVEGLYERFSKIDSTYRTTAVQAVISKPNLENQVQRVVSTYKNLPMWLDYKDQGVVAMLLLITDKSLEYLEGFRETYKKIEYAAYKPSRVATFAQVLLNPSLENRLDDVLEKSEWVYQKFQNDMVPGAVGFALQDWVTEKHLQTLRTVSSSWSRDLGVAISEKDQIQLSLAYMSVHKTIRKQAKKSGFDPAAVELNAARTAQSRGLESEESFLYYYMWAVIWPDNPFLYLHPYGWAAMAITGSGLLAGTPEAYAAEPPGAAMDEGLPEGIDSFTDIDIDGDGIPDYQDPDVDGDGIPNDLDQDIDGDGIENDFDMDDFDGPEVEFDDVEVDMDIEVDTDVGGSDFGSGD